MDVFDLDRSLVGDYSRFARSFAEIRAGDIRDKVTALYESGRFWPDPLISINPSFERGPTIDELVADGTLASPTGSIFRSGGRGLVLHRHQAEALSKASAGRSFVVTTGTGSGKSLCFFIPIIDRIVRAKLAGEAPRTRAIIVYPMNALANSQMEELRKFLDQANLPEALRPTFARYTGQDDRDERNRIRESKPDILLTNFMMLELLLTRQHSQDREVIDSAQGLEFLALDELHTYRGRQGADVAMLVRRVQDRLCRERPPIMIGTSATMASEGLETDRKAVVARVASRLFGTQVGPDAVIDESLSRATDAGMTAASLGQSLTAAIDGEISENLSDEAMRRHPLAVWIELEIGLEDGQKLSRRPPTTIDDAATKLADATGRDKGRCRQQLERMLTVMSLPGKDRGQSGDRAFMAFKLHRFISGAGFVYSTLRSRGRRSVTLEGQQYDPTDPKARLYPTHFCRACGQEYHPVTIEPRDDGSQVIVSRSIDDIPTATDGEDAAGYLVPFEAGDEDFAFDGDLDSYPEEWVEGTRLKPAHKGDVPVVVQVNADGTVGSGSEFWFVPGKFKFCLCCKDQPAVQARELTKLGGLSAEGRSSATTLLVSSALRWMNRPSSTIDKDRRKLLGFTDNRQDAALQAGNFNDTLFVGLLRGAIVAAVRAAGSQGLAQDQFGPAVQQALGFTPENTARRAEWMLQPHLKGSGPQEVSAALARVLSYRVWSDQRKGWRYTNPNLEETGLIATRYQSLDELVQDEDEFAGSSPLRDASAAVRKRAMLVVLEALRGALAVNAEALEPGRFETEGNASRQVLREPWLIGQREEARTARWLIIDAPRRADMRVRDENLILRGGPRSGLARDLVRSNVWGGQRLDKRDYRNVIETLLAAAENYGLVRKSATPFGDSGWQLVASSLRLVATNERADDKRINRFFQELYETIADTLEQGGGGLFGMEGREHTAQVEPERRMWREWRFRWGEEDRKNIADKQEVLRQVGEPDEFLPVLFCSPTMELGVDISAMNAVYLRNVPPTPANYAQRSGRAGRSGQAALVVTYCAAQSPHDQYYFARPAEMVRGIVRPPAIDIANRDLVTAHLHAVWLAEAQTPLPTDIPTLLDLKAPGRSVNADITAGLTAPGLARSASESMLRIVDSIGSELSPEAASWAQDRAAFVDEIVSKAFETFSGSFERWRTLYDGAHLQLEQAHARLQQSGLGGKERGQARELYNQANDQISLLERGSGSGSDFYSYRYLATEGFLPGYNFPRLPLYAFIPASGVPGGKGTYLQRARFLAISEFGPGSLIYHEGRAYRVNKARLQAGTRNDGSSGKLTTSTLFVCGRCGASHDTELERCHACAAPLGGAALVIRDVLRIENVETQPQERITANDEERQRRGFDIQTMFEWPDRGTQDVRSAIIEDELGPILRVDFSHGALIRRVNKGLRRRAEKSIFGFKIDPSNGRWVSSEVEDDANGPDTPSAQRVVPVVQDNKNAALIRFVEDHLSANAIATLQHALTRGLDIVYQLEESEVLSEPVPTREDRRAILSLEATEGGAGVLSRLISDQDALARVARAALGLMHFGNTEAAVQSGDLDDLVELEGSTCVRGCYRCLLSYFNQPDHELIDRTDPDVLRVLLRLARGTARPQFRTAAPASGWSEAIERWELPAADGTPLTVDGTLFPYCWRNLRVIAIVGPVASNLRETLEMKGYSVVQLPFEPEDEAPADLRRLLGDLA